jgi:hypothetical protein
MTPFESPSTLINFPQLKFHKFISLSSGFCMSQLSLPAHAVVISLRDKEEKKPEDSDHELFLHPKNPNQQFSIDFDFLRQLLNPTQRDFKLTSTTHFIEEESKCRPHLFIYRALME